jgi:hypothetical protein
LKSTRPSKSTSPWPEVKQPTVLYNRRSRKSAVWLEMIFKSGGRLPDISEENL